MTYLRRLILALALSASLAPAFAQAPAPVPALPDTERRTTYSISGTTCICAVNMALYGDGTDFQNWVEVFLNGVRVNFNDATFGWAITVPTQTLATRSRPIADAILTFTGVQTGTVQIVGARRPRRTSQFNEGTGVPTRNFNQVLTDIISQNREIWDKNNDMTGRGLFSQPGNTLGPLPLPAACSGKYLAFDVTGLLPTCLGGGPGGGNVNGPASSTDGDFALFNGTTGALLKDAPATVIQNALQNRVWASPNGSTGAPAFRALVGPDLPVPSASSLGGTQSVLAVAHTFMTGISTAGAPTVAIPVCADLSNAAASCATDATNATNIGSGTINTARLPAPFTSGTISGNTSKFGTVSGAVANGHCASYDVSGNLVDSGSACGASAMVLLNTLTASGSATLSDTTSLTATYSVYEIVFENILPATNATTCELQINSGGVQSTGYITTGFGNAAGAAMSFVNPTTFVPCSLTGDASNVASGGGINGSFRIATPSVAGIKHGIFGQSAYVNNGATFSNMNVGGLWNTAGAVTGFQVCISSAVPTCNVNITSGVIKIYGIQ